MAEREAQGSDSQALDPELVSRLRAELDQARAEQGELENRKEALTARIEALEEALEVLLDGRPHVARHVRGRAYARVPKRAAGRVRGRAVRVPSSADLVVDLLKSVDKPLHYRDIYEELKTSEFFHATSRGSLGDVDPAATLLSRFFKDPRLYRPRRGTYALVEWLDREDDQPTDDLPDAADGLAATLRLTHGDKSRFLRDRDVLGAAELALRDAGGPMHHLDLTEKMIALGPWKPTKSVPENVVSLRLAKDIREHGDRSRFRRFGRGIYGLGEWGDSE